MLESLEASIWPDENAYNTWFEHTGRRLWNEVLPEIVDEAIFFAPTIDFKEHLNDPTNILKATQKWQRIAHKLPVTFIGIDTLQEIPAGQSYMVNENTVYSDSLQSFWLLLWHTMHYTSFYRTTEKIALNQIDYDMNHEGDHARAYGKYDIGGRFALSFAYVLHNHDAALLPGFRPYTHSIPIYGYVETALAPTNPSELDLAQVGLTPEVYKQLIADGVDPVMHVLQPWFDAGVLQLSAS
jgi:hypothetical protein